MQESVDGIKICRKCKLPKRMDEFHRNACSKNERHSQCKTCKNSSNKLTPQQNRAKQLKWRRNNEEYSRAYMKAFREGTLDQFERRGPPKLISREDAIKRKKEQRNRYVSANPELIRETKRKSAAKPECKAKRKESYNRRRKENLQYRLASGLRSRVGAAFRMQHCKKATKTEALLGCSVSTLKRWLEMNFVDGMSWENYGLGVGKWHIDHIRPCSSYDLTDPEQQRACFHYSNLQPLWGVDNIAKSDSLEYVIDYQI